MLLIHIDREDFAHAISGADGARKDDVHVLLERMEKFRGASP